MKEGPDIASIAALIGDPARANMLTALMSGKALTARELAEEAGVTPQTASSHLARLSAGGLVRARAQGRHKFFELASDDVAQTLEALMGLARGTGQLRTRPGPKDSELRRARVCYDHLAGDMGVRMFRAMIAAGHLALDAGEVTLTPAGEAFVATLGIDPLALARGRAPLCRACLDWSERTSHLAGRLGRELLAHFEAQGWARRDAGSRAVHFSREGATRFEALFG